MMTTQEVAQYIIREYHKQNPETQGIEPDKLQALLYYVQGYSLGLTGKPAFEDKISAFKFGPGVSSVYREYKKYMMSIIPYDEISEVEIHDEALRAIVRLVLSDKSRYSSETLASMTRKEAPYLNNCGGHFRRGAFTTEIAENEIKDYFESEFLRRETDYDGNDTAWESIAEPASMSELAAIVEENIKLEDRLGRCFGIVAVVFSCDGSPEEQVRTVLILKDYGDELLVRKFTSMLQADSPSMILADGIERVSKSKLSGIIPHVITTPRQSEIVMIRLFQYVNERKQMSEGESQ